MQVFVQQTIMLSRISALSMLNHRYYDDCSYRFFAIVSIIGRRIGRGRPYIFHSEIAWQISQAKYVSGRANGNPRRAVAPDDAVQSGRLSMTIWYWSFLGDATQPSDWDAKAQPGRASRKMAPPEDLPRFSALPVSLRPRLEGTFLLCREWPFVNPPITNKPVFSI